MNGLIAFTPAREANGFWLGGNGGRSQQDRPSVISGEEAKNFYQSLIEEGGAVRGSRREKARRTAANSDRERSRRKEQARPTPTASEKDGHRLLKCAQEGDQRGLRELLNNGCNINFKDSYYWTAIMCASYAGQRGAVRLLLEKGAAWIGVVDTQGRDARDLADQAGHMEVVRELDSYVVHSDTPRSTSRSVLIPS